MTSLAISMGAANGVIFALVPGITGASGNISGILFNLAFRFLGIDYHNKAEYKSL